MNDPIYDVVVLGGGPAGYTAALYCARECLNTLVIEKLSVGGQMTQTVEIDNYPGIDRSIDGFALGKAMQNGAERFGAHTLKSEIIRVELITSPKKIVTDSGAIYAEAVIVAMGAEHRHLGLKNEKELTGKGICYCAVCDGMLFKNKTVAVIGGGNSAATDAILLSKICEKVYIIHRKGTMTAEKIYREPLTKAANIEFVWNSEVTEFLSDRKLNGVVIRNRINGETQSIKLDALFISIGRSPVSSIFSGQLSLDSKGYIIAGEDTKTNIDGVFAAGDIRTKPFRQIVTAASDGATAAHFAGKYIESIGQ